MTTPAWTLRAATAGDRSFVTEVNRTAMGEYLGTALGWDDAAQDAYFAEGFDPAGGEIIEVGGVAVGELLVEERPSELFLVRLALLPEWQGRGIGTAVVRTVVERARERGAVLVLDVLKANPRAARLYESLGFARIGETETDVSMRLEPKL